MAGETRQRIIEATERLIHLKGLSRVTTKEIARETGLSEGALYRHFEHKEEVFFEIIAQYLPAFLEVFRTHLPGTGEVRGNLETIALAAMDYFAQLIPMSASFLADAELLAQYRTKMKVIASKPVEGGPQRIEVLLEAYLDEEKQLGRLPERLATSEVTLMLMGACFQFTYFQQLMGETPAGQTREQFVARLIQGLMSSIETA